MSKFEERMDAYLNHSMSEREKRRFEEELKSDPNKAQQFEKMKEAARVVQLASMKELLDEIEQEAGAQPADRGDRKKQGSKVISIFSRGQLMGIAAAFTVLIAAAVWIFYPSSQHPAELAYEKYHQKDPGLPTTMGVVEDMSLQKAMIYYKQGQYEQAVEGFETLLETDRSDTVVYYLGLSYLEMGAFKNAERTLGDGVLTESEYQSAAEWYRALALLRLEQLEESRAQLTEISEEEGHPYAQRAAGLLAELR